MQPIYKQYASNHPLLQKQVGKWYVMFDGKSMMCQIRPSVWVKAFFNTEDEARAAFESVNPRLVQQSKYGHIFLTTL